MTFIPLLPRDHGTRRARPPLSGLCGGGGRGEVGATGRRANEPTSVKISCETTSVSSARDQTIETEAVLSTCIPTTAAQLITARATLTFDLSISGSVHAERLLHALHVMSANFGVDSSSRLPFIARTHRHTKSQTPLITVPTHRLRPAGVGITNSMNRLPHALIACDRWHNR